MLLLPLLLLWARAPMHFSTRNTRVLIAVSVTMILLTPLASRSSNHVAAAEGPYGRNDSVQADSGGGFRDGKPGLVEQPGQLREGTLVPPTPGRIVLIGRRWAFLPASVEAARATAAARSNETLIPSNQVSFRSQPAPSRRTSVIRLPSPNFKLRTSRLGANTQSSMSGGAAASRPADVQMLTIADLDPPKTSVAKAQMLISENLMLQRVVEAIRLDPADDRWTVSGEVTEFFDHNRLIIRTAQRANAK